MESAYHKQIKIGQCRAYPIMLAPMEDVSDLAFRLTCKKYGAGIVYTEMNHAASLVRGNDQRALTCQTERPLGIQVAGRNVDEVVEAAKIIQKRADIIDINLGCPGPNVIARGYGSALLEHPSLIVDIIKSLVDNIAVPVTAKMRAGYRTNEDFMLVAKSIEQAGASALTVHPRTKVQKYSGKADWTIIKQIKNELNIPIIGNGDVTTPSLAKQMFDQTRCDAIMIGRGAIGNPMIFEKIRIYFEEGEILSTTAEERIRGFELYLRYARKYNLFLKKRILRQAQHFTSTLPNASAFRKSLSGKDVDSIVQKTKEFLCSPTLAALE